MRWLFMTCALLTTRCASDDHGAPDANDANDTSAASDVAGGDATTTIQEDTNRLPDPPAALLQSSRALCDRAAECLPFFMGSQFGGDVVACTEREYATVLPILTDPGFAGTPEELVAVTGFFAGASCEAIRRFVLGGELPPALAISGTLADGAACVHPYQCASGLCRRSFQDPCGTCGAPTVAGGDCVGGLECGSAATCVAGKCAAYRERGQDCDDGRPCFPHDACLEGKCATALAEDAPCSSLVGECDLQGALLVCDLGAGTCQPGSFVERDAACGLIDGKAYACSGSSCDPSVFAGTCTAYAADGAACDDATGPHCQFHAACIAGTCQTYFGAACE